jgi:hypothetical protein
MAHAKAQTKVSFLTSLMVRLGDTQVNQNNGPKGELEEGQNIIGPMSDEACKLFVLFSQLKEKLADLNRNLQADSLIFRAEAARGGKSPDLRSFKASKVIELAEIDHLTLEANAISEIMWQSIRHDYPEATHGKDIAMIGGWRVATSEPEEPRVALEMHGVPISVDGELGQLLARLIRQG